MPIKSWHVSALGNRVDDRAIGIYKAPPGLSRAEFETQFKATIATMLELPIVQKNFFKHEMSHNAMVEVAEYPTFRSLMIATSQSIGLDVGKVFATEVITMIEDHESSTILFFCPSMYD
ncbi:hypothetical protein FB451DRAFT_1175140 [Mycena latifolia]|nr:hypothetical protein FB451DRAFT_1175140 [Mycena latifolia]